MRLKLISGQGFIGKKMLHSKLFPDLSNLVLSFQSFPPSSMEPYAFFRSSFFRYICHFLRLFIHEMTLAQGKSSQIFQIYPSQYNSFSLFHPNTICIAFLFSIFRQQPKCLYITCFSFSNRLMIVLYKNDSLESYIVPKILFSSC